MADKKQSDEHEHGRHAQKPEQIPPRGFKDITVRVGKQMNEDNLDIVAAGVAFYAFLALFPALAALISIYGLLFEPATVQSQLAQVAEFLPAQAQDLIGQILSQVAGRSEQALGWGAIISILLGLWSANNGTKALVKGLNIAYDQKESRSFFKLIALTLLFTFGGIIVVIVSIGLIIGLSAIIGVLELPSTLKTLLLLTRWVVLALLISGSLTVIYRYAPSRDNPKWRWVTWGSSIATLFWLAGSGGFSLYVSNFGNFNATYGSVAAVVILLFWFLLSSYAILLGAEINAEMEHQTKKDTTKGEEKPMGKRGAFPADDLGEAA
jgi:membrane protein